MFIDKVDDFGGYEVSYAQVVFHKQPDLSTRDLHNVNSLDILQVFFVSYLHHSKWAGR